MFHTKDMDIGDRVDEGSQDGVRIFEYGDEELSFLIKLVKLWISEERLFHLYEPLFNSYTTWLKRNQPNIDFYDYLQYTANNNKDIILNETTFKIAIEDGTLIDYENKITTQINAMLYFNNYVVYIRDMKFWVTSSADASKQYFYDING